MNSRKHIDCSCETSGAPAYPFTAQEILSTLRAALEEQIRGKLTFKRLGQLTGQRTNTAHYWWSQSVRRHLIALMRLLEQLPDARRHRLLADYCRRLPSFDHPWLAHDAENARVLGNLLRRKSGATFITGGTDAARTFAITALGHAFLQEQRRSVAGIDVHTPSDFVPVSGLFYVDHATDPSRVQHRIRTIWPEIETADVPVLLFNGVLSSVPALKNQILEFTRTRHVIVAEDEAHFPAELREMAPDQAWRIGVSFADAGRVSLRILQSWTSGAPREKSPKK